jgi:hypothetical protein
MPTPRNTVAGQYDVAVSQVGSNHAPSKQPQAIAVDDLNRQMRATLDLFRRTYNSIDERRGGWYHDLSPAPPGPVATALALLAFQLAGEEFEFADQCWAFLRERQIKSKDPLRDGGGVQILVWDILSWRLLRRCWNL